MIFETEVMFLILSTSLRHPRKLQPHRQPAFPLRARFSLRGVVLRELAIRNDKPDPRRAAHSSAMRSATSSPAQHKENAPCLPIIFLVISVIAAIFGFTGISAATAGIAKILFFIAIVVFIVLLLMALFGGALVM